MCAFTLLLATRSDKGAAAVMPAVLVVTIYKLDVITPTPVLQHTP